MNTLKKLSGRLRGGLSRSWAWTRRNREGLAWQALGGLIGTAIGLFFATIYLANR